jgi:peptide/nickel transport system permease protein
VSGYLGGRWDRRLERLVETIHTFPAIVVVALLRTIEGEASPISVIVAVAVVRWAEVARLVRAEAMRLQMEDFVSAARALGSSRLRILTRHILPNALGPVIVSSVFGVASVALLETAISFLELGPPARAPSWGETLAQAARHPDAIHLLVGPGVLLALTVGGSYLIADALRDALDPHTTRVLPAGR